MVVTRESNSWVADLRTGPRRISARAARAALRVLVVCRQTATQSAARRPMGVVDSSARTRALAAKSRLPVIAAAAVVLALMGFS